MNVREQVRAARREAYRDSILEAARSLFEQRGFRAITMSDIAKEAGVAKGTLYNYFESKEEVFAELADRERQRFLAMLDAEMTGHDGWDRVLGAVRYTLAFLATNASMLSVYMEATGGARDSAADPHQGSGEQAFASRLCQCLESLAQDGKLRTDLPVEFLVTSLSGLIDGIVRSWMSSGPPRDIDEYADRIVRLFRRGAEA